jgi:hypothetical protein
MSKAHLSRRTVIAGAAALSTTVITVAAQGANGPPEAHPDAELIALGAHFENLLREYTSRRTCKWHH